MCLIPEPTPFTPGCHCAVVKTAFYFKTEVFLVFSLIQSDHVRGDGEYEESQEGDQRLGGAAG